MSSTRALANDRLTRDIVYPFANANFLAKHPPLCIEGGDGVHVFDGRGKRYIDGQGGLWNVNVGHGRPEVKAAIVAQLGLRRYELVTLAAAQGTHSQHCRLAHGRKTLKVMAEDQLEAVARDYHDAGLSEQEVAMMEFAERISTDAAGMTDADALRLRELGFTDREIVDITLAAAARNYFSRAIQALGAEVQVPPGLSDGLRGALLAPL